MEIDLNCSPELREHNLTDVLPVQPYASLLQFHHPKQRQEQSRLPRASASNDTHSLSRLHHKADTIKSIGQPWPIRQNSCVELHSTMLGPGSWNLVRNVHGYTRFVKVIKLWSYKRFPYSICFSHLCFAMLWLQGYAGGILLSALHTHQLHLSLGEGEDHSRQQVSDWQSVGQSQTHQT